jgi:F-type H+-transporting ATPase subunit a
VAKKRVLGCSFPVFIVFAVVAGVLLIISFLGGGIGRAMFGDIGLPSVLDVSPPHVALPAEGIFHIGGFAVTNTLITAWISMLVLVLMFWAVTRRIKLIPTGLQNLIEAAMEWLLNFCQDVAGEKKGRKFFPVVATILLFVLMNSWISLIPGFISITYTLTEHGETHVMPLLRGANTDISFTFALGLIAFCYIEYIGFTMGGGFGYLRKFFNFAAFKKGVATLFRGKMKSGFGGIFMGGVDIFVGFLELIAEGIRIFSFTFRLFGNMLGGEILVLMMIFLMPYLVGVIFYGLEVLVGLVQAIIFGGLTLVFATMAATPHEEHEEAH